MQTVKLRLDHTNFYCPVTGQLIINEEDGQFEETPSLKGYWVNMTPDKPFFVAPELTEAWQEYLSGVDEDDFIEIAEFLASIDKPNWVVFETEYLGIPGDIVWIVIDMNYQEIDQ